MDAKERARRKGHMGRHGRVVPSAVPTPRREVHRARAPRGPDDDAGEWAICELVQRAAWAAEIGLDPRAVDLVALPPVPREVQRAA